MARRNPPGSPRLGEQLRPSTALVSTAPEDRTDPAHDVKANDPEFIDSYLLIPKADGDEADPSRTSAEAVVDRTPQRLPVELQRPSLSAASVLRRLGLVDVEKARPVGEPQVTSYPATRKGIF